MAETDSIGSDGIHDDRLCMDKVDMPLAPANRLSATAAEPFDNSSCPGNLGDTGIPRIRFFTKQPLGDAVTADDDDYGWDESVVLGSLGFHFGNEEPAESFWLVSCSEVALVEERFQTSEDEILRNHTLPERSSQELPNPHNRQLIDISSTPMQEPPDVLTPPHIVVETGRMLTQPDPAPRKRKEGAALTEYCQDLKRLKSAPAITVITVPSIPLPVMPRSVVDGLTPFHYIKSCFRILDAIKLVNVGGLAVSDTGLVELFARVSFSSRSGLRQNFQFVDICHNNPPFLSGYSEIFKRCKLWMSDSDAFLGPEAAGKLARVVGKIKRKGTADAGVTSVNLEVLSIQEHSWTDVAEQYLGITGLVLH